MRPEDHGHHIEVNPETMACIISFPNAMTGELVEVRPHLCDLHQHQPQVDHRGLIDLIFHPPTPQEGLSFLMTLDMARAIRDGLDRIIPWAEMNRDIDKEIGEK